VVLRYIVEHAKIRDTETAEVSYVRSFRSTTHYSVFVVVVVVVVVCW